MYVLTTHLQGAMTWVVRPKDPPKARISSTIVLINPLVPVGEGWAKDRIVPVHDGWFVESPSVRFLVTDENYGAGESPLYGLDILPDYLRALRIDSADPFQATDVRSEALQEIGNKRLPARRLVRHPARLRLFRPDAGQLQVAKRVRPTARFLARPLPGDQPVYAELALDAMAAWKHDPRKAILFSAFAIEQMARANLDAAYDRARAKPGKEPGQWRWVTRATSGSQTEVRDPVFERLRSNARRNIEVLLVEMPLYVWGRSLLDDDKRLYDMVIRLQDTRNALTHVGEPSDRERLITLDSQGAYLAVATADRAFWWFQEVNYFVSINRP